MRPIHRFAVAWTIALAPLVPLPRPASAEDPAVGPTNTAGHEVSRAAGPQKGSDRDETVSVDGKDRSYTLHLPPGVEGSGMRALVFNFHGSHGSADQQAELSGFDDYADRNGFVVVYPEGVDKTWNDGRGTTLAAQKGVDDVKFARMIYDQVRASIPIDPKRVYATGLSSGAILSARLACDMSDLFAAVGMVAGSMATRYRPMCRPVSPVSVVSIVGDADELVPMQGGEEGWKNREGEGGALDSQADLVKFWARQDACKATPAITRLPSAKQDGTAVTKTEYGGCKDGSAVVLYTIAGGGHAWPPKEFRSFLLNRMAGKSSANIDATDVVWTFFSDHAKDSQR